MYLYNIILLTMSMWIFRKHKGLLILLSIAIFLGYASQPFISNNSYQNSFPEKTILKQHPFIVSGVTASTKIDRPLNPSNIIKKAFPDRLSLEFSSKLISSFIYRYSSCNFYCKPNTIILSFICKLQI